MLIPLCGFAGTWEGAHVPAREVQSVCNLHRMNRSNGGTEVACVNVVASLDAPPPAPLAGNGCRKAVWGTTLLVIC